MLICCVCKRPRHISPFKQIFSLVDDLRVQVTPLPASSPIRTTNPRFPEYYRAPPEYRLPPPTDAVEILDNTV